LAPCRVKVNWVADAAFLPSSWDPEARLPEGLAASGRDIDHITLHYAAENHLNTSNHFCTLEMANFVPYVPAAPHSKIVATWHSRQARTKPALDRHG
jgi:hypothetical protein